MLYIGITDNCNGRLHITDKLLGVRLDITYVDEEGEYDVISDQAEVF